MSADETNLTDDIEEVLKVFSVLDNDVLLYRRPVNITFMQVMQMILLATRMIFKYRCRYVICDIKEFASVLNGSLLREAVRKQVPKVLSSLDYVVFVIDDPLKWKESEWMIREIELSCPVLVVQRLEEAKEFIRYIKESSEHNE